jgi:hypothetical protein
VSLALGLFGALAFREEGWRLWLGVSLAALGAADLVWGYSKPILTMTPYSVIVRRSLFLPDRELHFSQIYSWAHTKTMLVFRTQDGRLTDVVFSLLPAARRQELVARLDGLGLQRPGPAPVDAPFLRRRMRRITAALLALGLVASAVAIWWAER